MEPGPPTASDTARTLLAHSTAACARVPSISTAMTARYSGSVYATSESVLAIATDLARYADSARSELRRSLRAVVKALDSAVEGLEVTAAQLLVTACALERGTACGLEEVATELDLSISSEISAAAVAGSALVALSVPIDVFHSMGEQLYLRSGVSADACRVTGSGIAGYLCGGSEDAHAHNIVDITVSDTHGCVIPSLVAEDIDVSICGGATTSGIRIGGDGLLSVRFAVPNGTATPVTLSVSVCGQPLAPIVLKV